MVQAKHYKYIIGGITATTGALLFLFSPPWLLRGRKGGVLIVVLSTVPLLILFLIYHWYILRKRIKETKLLIDSLVRIDNMWNLRTISNRIEEVFFSLQKAIVSQDATSIEGIATESLANKYRLQFDQLRLEKKKEIRDQIILKRQAIVKIEDFKDNDRDCFWVIIWATMQNYFIDASSNLTIGNAPLELKVSSDLWKFVRHPQKGWIVDDIDTSLELSEIIALQSLSESCSCLPKANTSDEMGKALVECEWMIQKSDKLPEVPSINSPVLALAIGLLAPWLVILLFFLRAVLNSD